MRVSRPLIAICLVGSSLGLSLPYARADLSVNGWALSTSATDKIGPDSGDTVNRFRFFNLPNPLAASDLAHDGLVSSSTSYDFAWDTGDGLFNWGFSHKELGLSYSPGTAESSASLLRFTATGGDMLYDLSGTYASNSSTHWLNASVMLYDVTGAASVFNWNELHASDPANPAPSFVVGEIGNGNVIPTLDGTPMGTLLAGHTYELSYSFLLRDFGGNSGAATAWGGMNLNISSAAPINSPAPGAVLLAIVGLPAVVWFKRRQAKGAPQ